MCVYTVVQHRIGQLDGCHADGRCRRSRDKDQWVYNSSCSEYRRE